MINLITQLLVASMMLQSAVTAQPAPLLSQTQLPTAAPRAWTPPPQLKPEAEPFSASITAPSALVIDQASGHILYERDREQIRSIASITKLMTALVFLDHNPGWDNAVTISGNDYRPGASADLLAGETYTVRDVFNTMLIASSNEAAVALARIAGLSTEDFIVAMNAKANDLGMVHSHFTDVSGLDIGNVSTASDLAILANVAFSQTDIFGAVHQSRYEITPTTAKARLIHSTNKSLNQPFGLDGDEYIIEAGKTGYVEQAGYCFISQVRNQGGKRLITIILGSSTIDQRFIDAKSLDYWAFTHYIWPDVQQ